MVVFALAASITFASVAQAQQLRVAGPAPFDKIRLSGFLWRGKASGTLNFEALAGVPEFEQGISLTDTLGMNDSHYGWIFDVNVGVARRHRFIFEFSQLKTIGSQGISLGPILPPPIAGFDIAIDSALVLKEVHGFYNFLFAATPRVEAGVLLGVARFDTLGTIQSPFGGGLEQFAQVIPSFGGNLMVNPTGRVRGYFEMTGFPRVNVDDLSGYQYDIVARLEMFAVRSFAVLIGYRRYRLVVDEEVQNVGVDLTWDGFTIGGQVRY